MSNNSDFLKQYSIDLSGAKCAEIIWEQQCKTLIINCILCSNTLKFLEYQELKDHLFSQHLINNQFIEKLKDEEAEIEDEEFHVSVESEMNASISVLKAEINIEHSGNFEKDEIIQNSQKKSEHKSPRSPQTLRKKVESKTKKTDTKSGKPKRKGNWHRVYKTIEVDGAIRYQCEYDKCNKHFNTRDNLRKHERIHKCDWKPHPCEYCNRICRSARELRDHERIHTGERPYKCDQCDKDFRTMTAIITHKNRIHLGIKNYGCQFCGAKFFVKDVRNDHERTHTGEKPFVCDVCGDKFNNRSSLNVHRGIHFRDQTPKAFECKLCDAKFHRKPGLKSHMIEVHTTEKKFVCNICNAAYKRTFQLNQHLKIHQGTNEYQCTVCDQKFPKYSRVKDHIRMRHRLKIKSNYIYTPANISSSIENNETSAASFKKEEDNEVGINL